MHVLRMASNKSARHVMDIHDRVRLPGCILRCSSAERNQSWVSAWIIRPGILQTHARQLRPYAPRRHGREVPEVDGCWTIIEDASRGSYGSAAVSGHIPSESQSWGEVRR